MPYISQKDLDTIKDALAMLDMKTASFSDPAQSNPFTGRDEFTAKVREATRIWRESWIIGPIEEVIIRIEDRKSKAERIKAHNA